MYAGGLHYGPTRSRGRGKQRQAGMAGGSGAKAGGSGAHPGSKPGSGKGTAGGSADKAGGSGMPKKKRNSAHGVGGACSSTSIFKGFLYVMLLCF